MSPTTDKGTQTEIEVTTPHRRFYFDDGNVVFLVETTLFKIHRYFLKRDSPIFQDMFSLPAGEGSAEGMSDDNPIRLEGTLSVDFERLLSIFYPVDIGTIELSTTEEWASVLELAVKWQFDGIRKLVAERNACPVMDQIRLARQYQQHSWLLAAHVKLCLRAEALTLQEARQLGLEATVAISAIRHKARGDRELPADGGMFYDYRPQVEKHLKEFLQKLDGHQY